MILRLRRNHCFVVVSESRFMRQLFASGCAIFLWVCDTPAVGELHTERPPMLDCRDA